MSAAIVALVVGTLLAIGALAFVLYPLFFDEPSARQPAPRPVEGGAWTDDVAVAALREIEFDKATGKLSDADYNQLKEQYTRQALTRMRAARGAGDAREASSSDDEVEAAIRAYREAHPRCDRCGPRPETDAVFCSNCGRYLPGRCEQCGRHVDEIGARFCAACGHRLAA
jgi:ribosomal protein L37E